MFDKHLKLSFLILLSMVFVSNSSACGDPKNKIYCNSLKCIRSCPEICPSGFQPDCYTKRLVVECIDDDCGDGWFCGCTKTPTILGDPENKIYCNSLRCERSCSEICPSGFQPYCYTQPDEVECIDCRKEWFCTCTKTSTKVSHSYIQNLECTEECRKKKCAIGKISTCTKSLRTNKWFCECKNQKL